jgi:hypothetical protein
MRSGLITTPVYDAQNPNAIFPYGEPLVTFGFENRGVVNGLGLVSRGLLWQIHDFWFDSDYYSNLSTSWAAASGSSVSTTWSAASGASVATTWTSPQYGLYGEYTTI